MDDETYTKMGFSTLLGPQYYISHVGENASRSEKKNWDGKIWKKSWSGKQSVRVVSRALHFSQLAL